jgi:hypothetical protein
MAGFQNPPAGFGHNFKGGSFGGEPAGFPKSANPLTILMLMIFSRNFFIKFYTLVMQVSKTTYLFVAS